jgi:hypothetical protein
MVMYLMMLNVWVSRFYEMQRGVYGSSLAVLMWFNESHAFFFVSLVNLPLFAVFFSSCFASKLFCLLRLLCLLPRLP